MYNQKVMYDHVVSYIIKQNITMGSEQFNYS